jgi:hypothetical protein
MKIENAVTYTKAAQISPGNIAYPSLSKPVEPCRSTIMSVDDHYNYRALASVAIASY